MPSRMCALSVHTRPKPESLSVFCHQYSDFANATTIAWNLVPDADNFGDTGIMFSSNFIGDTVSAREDEKPMPES